MSPFPYLEFPALNKCLPSGRCAVINIRRIGDPSANCTWGQDWYASNIYRQRPFSRAKSSSKSLRYAISPSISSAGSPTESNVAKTARLAACGARESMARPPCRLNPARHESTTNRSTVKRREEIPSGSIELRQIARIRPEAL